MANTQKAEASAKAIKDANIMWDNFILFSKIIGAITCIILIIMALALV